MMEIFSIYKNALLTFDKDLRDTLACFCIPGSWISSCRKIVTKHVECTNNPLESILKTGKDVKDLALSMCIRQHIKVGLGLAFQKEFAEIF